jgi:MFS transporter, DHA3 family, macrolide efflux protein
MQDIVVAVLRQTELPRADLPAAVRAFMVANNVGMLIALALAPTVFDAIGVAASVIACGLCLLSVAIAGLLRHGGDDG